MPQMRRYIFAKPTLILSLFFVLVSLPDAATRWTSLFRPTAEAASNFVVTSTGDGVDSNLGDGICNDGTGACTLRAAIEQANNLAGDDTITFSVPVGSIVTLNTALPEITGNLTIDGSAANQITVQRTTAVGAPDFRVLKIAPGITVNLTRLKISNGRLASGNPGEDGGGIHNSGTLTLTGCDISGNRGDFGGGIYNLGSLTIINSSISNNSSIGSPVAGIISTGTGNILNITNSTVANNTNGAGIFIGPGTGTIINSTVSNNSTQGGGGGILIGGTPSTILNITNTTITGNRANSPGNTGGTGGGIQRLTGTVTLRNTIVAGNVRGTGTTADDIAGAVESASSFNLIGIGGSGGLTNGVNSNQVGVTNPGLGALGNEGGSTLTHRLLGGSPAIDAGDNCVLNNSCVPALPAALTTDQRGPGFNRAMDGNGDTTITVDIGAYEAQTTPPASLVVTNTADSGAGSLRQAILDANANPGNDPINFQPGLTGTITLATALPNLSSMSIFGSGASQINVQRSMAGGTPDFRIFTINPNQTVSISGLTISNGNATGAFPGNAGGGVLNQGTMVLTDCAVIGNSAAGGGGVSNLGEMLIVNSTIRQNTSSGSGGGIANSTGESQSSILRINNSTISNNTSQSFGGGGISNIGTVLITNSTISANSGVNGGGINNSNPMRLTNVTITNNTASNAGGGVYNPGIGTISLGNTIIAGNTAPSGPDGNGFNFNSQDYNLMGNTSQVNFTGTTTHNITNVNALLSSLGNFGGPTQTHALLPGSPAIDAANNCVLTNTCSPVLEAAITTDQRGAAFPRAVDANGDGIATVDIGAYETVSIVVTNTQDSGAGSLRQAITDANSRTDGPIITFQPGLTGTISLLSALPNINASMGIAGPGSSVLTVARSAADGTANFRIFAVNSTGIMVSISGLTISNGNADNATLFPNSSGGGILNFGTLTITGCVVSANNANGGGGILNLGTLTLNNSTVSGNSAGSAGGGGIMSRAFSSGNQTASLTLNNSTISGNTCANLGAGIYNSALSGSTLATLTILHSTISGNINSGSDGGGIYSIAIFGGDTNLRIDNSTISGNTAVRGGGLAHVSNGTGSIATANLTNTTITANNASNSTDAAGGIYLTTFESITTLILRNTLVAGNLRNSGTIASDIFGAADPSGSFNLIGDGTGMTGLTHGTNGNQVGTAGTPINPRLAALANNGGPTQTHALLAGSPALDAGDNTLATNAGLTTDQRGTGFARIVDAADAGTTATVDIGAFEAQVSLPDLADQAINEDSSLSLPFNVGGTITSVTATSSNTALVPNSPANITVTGSGSSRTLVINPVANAFGSSTITVTVNGANSQSMNDTFMLTVNPINDAPSFTRGSNQTVNENAGAQTVNNWATNISAGPNETGQTLTFNVTNNSNPGLFSAGPAISSDGTLTYTPATGVSGTATISITLSDDGGTANGGVNTSGTQSFSITVLEGGSLAFSSATYSVAENAGSATITINRSGGSAGTATVLFTTSNGTATGGDYTFVSQTITFNNGEVSKTVDVVITDDLGKEADETINLTLSNAGGSGQLGAQTSAVLTILDNDPVGGYLRFSSANYNTTESSATTTITVERIGDTTAAVAVNYFTTGDSLTVVPCTTVNGFATSRCDYTTAVGTLQFPAGETAKTFAVLISQDNYVEGPETITLGISNPTGGAALATPSAATLTITDDAVEPATNPIDEADNFVRQHYHDFLNREPDASGLAFWSNQITECQQPGATCNADERRINVSAAFFLSIEFQETGYLVERLYKSAYGDAQGTSNFGPTHQLAVPIIRFHEFLPDTQQIGKDVVVGVGDWQAKLEANKVAFTQDFVARTRFTTAFPTTLSPAQFVDALFANAGVTPSAAERASLIGEFGGAGNTADTAARARALRRVAENSTLTDQEKNKAFVLMQYFGYLRRDPNASPDIDYSGYDFWLSKLNQFNGNFVDAEMVKAFITSGEYRQRFGP